MLYFTDAEIYVCEKCGVSYSREGEPYGEKEFIADLLRDAEKTARKIEAALVKDGVDAPAFAMALAFSKLSTEALVMSIDGEKVREKEYYFRLFKSFSEWHVEDARKRLFEKRVVRY